jgi:hypothetical protein
MRLSGYGGQCYFAESSDCSLVLAPYPADRVNKASLAIRADRVERRKVVVSQFLTAAGVPTSSAIAEALDGREYRGRSGSKNVTVAVVDDEFVITVVEGDPDC